MTIPPKLRWRCRRGTRELDLVLERFLEREYERLAPDERAAFETLLAQQDPDLARWLWGGEPPPDEWAALINRVQAASGIDR